MRVFRNAIKGAIDESAINRYLGAFKNKIKDVVHGEVTLRLAPAVMGDALVVVVEVPKAESRPLRCATGSGGTSI